MKKILISIEIVIIVAIGAFLFLIYSGWYNIAATAGHYDVVRWTLETTMENSVRRRAQGLAVPSLEQRDMAQGFSHFDRMCVLCHGAPGVAPSEIGKWIVPSPPDLATAAPEWSAAELFWIVQNGIRMSGMPAFGPTHADEELWNLVVFLRGLPQLSPAGYRTLSEQKRAQPTPPNGHDHGGDRNGQQPEEKPAGELPPRLRLPADADTEVVHLE